MKLRQHRASFAESMETLVHLEPTAQALQEYISQQQPPDMKLLAMKYQGSDHRRHDKHGTWGETWLVAVYLPDGSAGVFGITDRAIAETPITNGLFQRFVPTDPVEQLGEVADRDFFNIWAKPPTLKKELL